MNHEIDLISCQQVTPIRMNDLFSVKLQLDETKMDWRLLPKTSAFDSPGTMEAMCHEESNIKFPKCAKCSDSIYYARDVPP